ncbi:MAG: 4'-phosphopantetheinyl transferase superfamily protein [Flavobacteriales bacterium]|nr:4'-phosphopantetheinyl transferase superfamily protein [Flavobacteriales bacterium]
MKAKRSLIVHCEGPVPAQLEKSTSGMLLDAAPLVWFATLESIRDRKERYHALLNEEELARAERFRFPKDRNRYILGHGLLRETLGVHLGRSAKDLELLRGEFGKPFLEGHPVHFNLSDTKDAVLLALSHHPIGADIETMNRHTDHERVAEHYFTPTEIASIADAADGKRRFLELWTRKEAVLKASGVGIMDDLHSLDVGGALNQMMISHPDFVRLAAAKYYVCTARIGTDHLVSIATEVAPEGWRIVAA